MPAPRFEPVTVARVVPELSVLPVTDEIAGGADGTMMNAAGRTYRSLFKVTASAAGVSVETAFVSTIMYR